ncbi:MAG: hypothetical protein HDT09_04960 [Bacteroidales bacterium]|nr:hypothetical protein [Bacteroidales bacterium]
MSQTPTHKKTIKAHAQTATKPTPRKRHFVSGPELQLGNPANAKEPGNSAIVNSSG